jgi:hypothetical protein
MRTNLHTEFMAARCRRSYFFSLHIRYQREEQQDAREYGENKHFRFSSENRKKSSGIMSFNLFFGMGSEKPSLKF